jgi:NitT/TauT family transport system permease protein
MSTTALPSPFKEAIRPYGSVSRSTRRLIVLFWLAALGLYWALSPSKLLPRPDEVRAAFGDLWFNQGLGRELLTSFMLNLEALAWTTAISLAFSYLAPLPLMRPVVKVLSRLRFLTFAGIILAFRVVIGGGHDLKVAVLVFGMSTYFITAMSAEILKVPDDELDHARTLRMGDWRTLYETGVLGRADTAIEVMRQNAAIGWMLIAMAEGLSFSEGGIGVLLLVKEKYVRLAPIMVIQLVVLMIALLQDVAIARMKRAACPYADLEVAGGRD